MPVSVFANFSRSSSRCLTLMWRLAAAQVTATKLRQQLGPIVPRLVLIVAPHVRRAVVPLYGRADVKRAPTQSADAIAHHEVDVPLAPMVEDVRAVGAT